MKKLTIVQLRNIIAEEAQRLVEMSSTEHDAVSSAIADMTVAIQKMKSAAMSLGTLLHTGDWDVNRSSVSDAQSHRIVKDVSLSLKETIELTEDMKITIASLRQMIHEELKRNIVEAKLKVGDIVKGKSRRDTSGWWKILELFPDDAAGKVVAKIQLYTPTKSRTPMPVSYANTDTLTKVEKGARQ